MNISEFYAYQAKARRVTSVEEVKAIAATNSKLYKDIIYPWLPDNRSASIYEAACGPGILLTWLRNIGYSNLKGSDFSQVQIEIAAASGFDVRCTDSVRELQVTPSSSLDCIIPLDFFEHLEKPVFLDFLAESYRVLKHGGKLILRGPNGDSPVLGRALYNDITHVTAYTSVAMSVIMEMIGFSHIYFKDETLSAVSRSRWLKVPLAWLAQQTLRVLIRFATRENIRYFSASYFICAAKD